MFFLEKVSDAAANIAISLALADSANCKPFLFGVKADIVS
jgi:hypothetical protein